MSVGRQRPIRLHRFAIETELATAGDIDDETLSRTLTRLATAGLHGMVLAVREVVLDGKPFAPGEDELESEAIRQLRPPPDERIGEALRELEKAVGTLRAVIGLTPVRREEVA